MARLFKKKSEFSKTIVILDITLFILYIITNIIMQWKRGFCMPSDINIGVFGFLTGELGILSFIKRSKLTTEAAKSAIQTIPDIYSQASLQQTQQNNNNQLQGAAG